jgi:mono/diheme cytochrome c family protein
MTNNYMSRYIFKSLLLIALAVIEPGCNRDRRMPGWDYFPDMFYSTAYETFSRNPNFKDGMTMRVPPTGTVPLGYTPFEYTIDPESRLKAGIELKNPYTLTDDNLLRGKAVFGTFCIICHGEKGEGDGFLFTSGLYPKKPLPLSRDNAVVLKDGEIYHTITLGFGTMGAYGTQIQPEDRWKVVLYIRQLQKNDSTKQIP